MSEHDFGALMADAQSKIRDAIAFGLTPVGLVLPTWARDHDKSKHYATETGTTEGQIALPVSYEGDECFVEIAMPSPDGA